MAIKISELDLASSITGEEVFPLAYDGHNYKFKLGDIKTLVNKTDLDLGNVDNTPDLTKPISNPVQSAINIINYRIDNAVATLTPQVTIGILEW